MYAAFGHVLVLILMFGLIPLGLGLISAALLSRAKIRGEGIYRWFLFLPQVLTSGRRGDHLEAHLRARWTLERRTALGRPGPPDPQLAR